MAREKNGHQVDVFKPLTVSVRARACVCLRVLAGGVYVRVSVRELRGRAWVCVGARGYIVFQIFLPYHERLESRKEQWVQEAEQKSGGSARCDYWRQPCLNSEN